MAASTQREACASCESRDLHLVLDLGDIPLAGAFPSTLDHPSHESYPLSLVVCARCYLVQVPEDISAEVMFRDYRYKATVPLSAHFAAFADDVPASLGVASDDFIVEVGCNDGVLLEPLHQLGYTRLLGIDPAANITRDIRAEIPVVNDFFGVRVATRVRAQSGLAAMLVANNVFAHVPDPHDFLRGVTTLLADDGKFVFEVHYVRNLIETSQFDTIYHEHRYYYSLSSLQPLLETHGLSITRAEVIANHGGSLRVVASRAAQPPSDVQALLDDEASEGLRSLTYYSSFSERVATAVAEIRRVVGELPASSVLAAYGAAGRAVTLLNYLPDVARRVEYVVDESPERIGRFIPSVRIPVVAPTQLASDPPDVLVLTAWTYEHQIRKKLEEQLGNVPRCLIPLPDPHYA